MPLTSAVVLVQYAMASALEMEESTLVEVGGSMVISLDLDGVSIGVCYDVERVSTVLAAS